MATSATPPSHNTVALLDAADESHTGALAAGTDFDTAKEGDNGVDHTEGTAREDGDSQPLHDVITDPVIDALTAHARVLTSTIAGVDEADSIWLSLGSPKLSTTALTMSPKHPRWRQ